MPEPNEPRPLPSPEWFEALRRLARLIDRANDIPTFATALTSYLSETFSAQASSLVLVDHQIDELVFHTGSGAPAVQLNQVRLKRGEGIVGWVCEHHRPVNVADARSDHRYSHLIDQRTGFFTRSVICVPLYRSEQVEGAVEVMNRLDGQPFTDEQLGLLELIGEQVELLIANATLITGLQQRNAELSTLIDIDQAVNAVHDLDELLTILLNAATAVARAAGSSVVLCDEESDSLTFFHAVGPAKDELAGFRIAAGQGVVGHCIDHAESVYVPNAYEDKRFFADVDLKTGFRTTSLLAVPLQTPSGVIGALEVVNLESVADAAALIGLMEAFASQAAMALERAQLHRKLRRRVDLADQQLRVTNRSLRIESAKLTSMIEKMADGVVMIDSDGRILLVNSAARRMFALGEGELAGQPALEIPNLALGAVLTVGVTGPEGFELRLEQPAPRTLQLHVAAVETESGRVGKVVVCSDITELKELAQMRTELVSFVSHELRTPLTSIKGFVSALLSDAKMKDEDHRSFIQIIDHECDRLRRMVADLLCMSRIDTGRALEVHWQRLDLREVIVHVIEAQRIYSPHHHLLFDDPEEPLVVDADRDKIEQILTNLVNNAIKYSPRGSEVLVWLEQDAQNVAIAVSDEGFGIAPEELPHLFQQYSRLSGAAERNIAGSGLGLFLTKHLVEAHGGQITVASVPDAGSTFRVEWPKRREWALTEA